MRQIREKGTRRERPGQGKTDWGTKSTANLARANEERKHREWLSPTEQGVTLLKGVGAPFVVVCCGVRTEFRKPKTKDRGDKEGRFGPATGRKRRKGYQYLKRHTF